MPQSHTTARAVGLLEVSCVECLGKGRKNTSNLLSHVNINKYVSFATVLLLQGRAVHARCISVCVSVVDESSWMAAQVCNAFICDAFQWKMRRNSSHYILVTCREKHHGTNIGHLRSPLHVAPSRPAPNLCFMRCHVCKQKPRRYSFEKNVQWEYTHTPDMCSWEYKGTNDAEEIRNTDETMCNVQ